MRLEILEQNSKLHTRRNFLFWEANVFMKQLYATSCHCWHIQNTEKTSILKITFLATLQLVCWMPRNYERDLPEFFAHDYLPSLSIQFRSTDKSDTIFGNFVETSSVKPDFTAEKLNGDTVAQAIVSKGSTNFGRFCRNKFTAYLFSKYRQNTLNRIDIAFDIDLVYKK